MRIRNCIPFGKLENFPFWVSYKKGKIDQEEFLRELLKSSNDLKKIGFSPQEIYTIQQIPPPTQFHEYLSIKRTSYTVLRNYAFL